MPTLEYYNKVLEINPNDYLSLNNKAWLLIEKKEYNNALQDINKALQLNSNDGFVSDTKGFILFKMKKYKRQLYFLKKHYLSMKIRLDGYIKLKHTINLNNLRKPLIAIIMPLNWIKIIVTHYMD